MKYIIDMIDDMRENIQNSKDYTLLAMLLKEDDSKNFQNAGEKAITSLHIDHNAKELQLGFLDEHPLMPVIGFGENHEQKQYIFFVTN
jgi:hypothetical protein